MASIILFNKPFQVLSQFTDKEGRETLKSYLPQYTEHYPAGRLDYDSEGLMLLTDSGELQHKISAPKHKMPKTYWVQVEGVPDETALQQWRDGIALKDGITKPAQARLIPEPAGLWPRTPPIRERREIPTQWLELTITEGKNRQVRRMTAAAGYPTLRLIRAAIGQWHLKDLQPGDHRQEIVHLPSTPSRPLRDRRDKNRSPQGQRTKHPTGRQRRSNNAPRRRT